MSCSEEEGWWNTGVAAEPMEGYCVAAAGVALVAATGKAEENASVAPDRVAAAQMLFASDPGGMIAGAGRNAAAEGGRTGASDSADESAGAAGWGATAAVERSAPTADDDAAM